MILEYIHARRAIFQIHTGSGKGEPYLVEKFMRFLGSDTKIHLVHLGGTVRGHFFIIPRLSQWLSEGYRVFCDTSCAYGFSLRWLFREASNEISIANSILFASDEPWSIYESEVTKVLKAGEQYPDLIEKILWKNASSLYDCVNK